MQTAARCEGRAEWFVVAGGLARWLPLTAETARRGNECTKEETKEEWGKRLNTFAAATDLNLSSLHGGVAQCVLHHHFDRHNLAVVAGRGFEH